MSYHRALITYHPSSAATKQSGEMAKDVITRILSFLLSLHSSLLEAAYVPENPHVKLIYCAKTETGFERVCVCVCVRS